MQTAKLFGCCEEPQGSQKWIIGYCPYGAQVLLPAPLFCCSMIKVICINRILYFHAPTTTLRDHTFN